MSIKLKTQEVIEKKLAKLINEGKSLSEETLKKEHIQNWHNISGHYEETDIEELSKPAQYEEPLYSVKKWKIKCLHALSQLPLQNTAYSNVLELLKEYRDEKGKEIYLAGIDIQEVTLNLEAILENLKDGIFENLFLAIEVQSVLNHLEQAQELFDEDQYVLAGLISFCSLESLLTELCRENLKDNEKMQRGLEGKSNYLINRNIINGPTHKTILKLTKTRDKIAHGDYKSVSKEQVREVMMEIKSIVRNQMPND